MNRISLPSYCEYYFPSSSVKLHRIYFSGFLLFCVCSEIAWGYNMSWQSPSKHTFGDLQVKGHLCYVKENLIHVGSLRWPRLKYLNSFFKFSSGIIIRQNMD